MRFDCIPPEFSPFRNFKKNIGKLNSLTVHKKKKKKKKSRPTDPIFKFWSGEGNITIFFFGLMYVLIATAFVTNYLLYKMDIDGYKVDFFFLGGSKILSGNEWKIDSIQCKIVAG